MVAKIKNGKDWQKQTLALMLQSSIKEVLAALVTMLLSSTEECLNVWQNQFLLHWQGYNLRCS